MIRRICKRIATIIRDEWQWFKFRTRTRAHSVRFIR